MSGKFNIAMMRLTKEHQRLLKNPVPNLLAHPDPKNIFLWHFLIYDLKDSPYEGGFYHGQLIFPTDYPQSPPKLIFKTPNGRFKPDEKICLSFTNFHPESWSASWNVENMLIGLISFMNTDEHTTGSISTSNSEKRRLARESIDFNSKSAEYNKLFGDFVRKYVKQEENRRGTSFQDDASDGGNTKIRDYILISLLVLALAFFYLKMKNLL